MTPHRLVKTMTFLSAGNSTSLVVRSQWIARWKDGGCKSPQPALSQPHAWRRIVRSAQQVGEYCDPRCCGKHGSRFQNICVTPTGTTETQRDDLSPIESEFACELNFYGTWFQVYSNAKARTAGLVDKLNPWRICG